MDPLSALGVAVNVISIVDIAAKIISETLQIAQATDGYLTEHREADEVATDLQTLSSRLSQSETDWLAKYPGSDLDANEKELQNIAAGCQEVAKQLMNNLRSLKRNGKSKGIAAIRSGLLVLWRRDDIERYQARLQRYREAMNTRILNGLREHIKAIDLEHDVRFTSLDESAQNLAKAILESRDVFKEKLDIHTDMLEDIRNREDRNHKLLIQIASERGSSPVPPSYAAALADGDDKQPLLLHEAAQVGDMRALRKLVNHPATDANSVDDDGLTAMHIARNRDAAEELFDTSAKLLNARAFDGRTPLHTAVSDRRLDVVKFLLSKHADKAKKDEDGKTALEYAEDCPAATFMLRYGHDTEATAADHLKNTGLFHMAWLGDIEGVKFYLGQGAKVDARNVNEETGLTESCRHGDLDIVNILLDHGADKEAKLKDHDWRPLSIAIKRDRLDVVSELLARGADKEAKVRSGCNAMSEAAYNTRFAIARILVNNGARIGDRDHQGSTALHRAVEKPDMNFLEFLLARCSLPDLNVASSRGATALVIAASEGRTEMVEALLRAGADPSIPNKGGYTPLSVAAQRNRVSCVKSLLNYNVNPSRPADSSRQDAGSWTPLQEACFHRHTEVVRLLLEAKANTEVWNHEKRTALHQAVRGRDKRPEILRMLLEHGALIEPAGWDAMTPLAEACQYGNAELIEILLAAGANSEAPSLAGAFSLAGQKQENGFTPLMRAVMGDMPQVVPLLVKYGANVEARTATTGTTALLVALEHKRYDVFNELLIAGAKPDTARVDGMTPLMRAAKDCAREQVMRLLALGADPKRRDRAGRTAWITAKHTAKEHRVRDILGPGGTAGK